MFGAYEICAEGRLFHGNVTLKEHRVFERDGDCALFLVKDMAAVPIAPELARAIERLEPGPGGLIPDALMRALRACGLVDAGETEAGALHPAGTDSGSRDLGVRAMGLFLAQTCNMRCGYCYGGKGEYGAPGMMKAETALAAVDWLLENSGISEKLSIGFFGGEPLLNVPVLKLVVEYARKRAKSMGKTVVFTVSTNASLLDDDIVAYLLKESIQPLVSLDGPPEVQNRQRPFRNGRGSYDRVLARIQIARASFPIRSARATVHGENDPFEIRRGLEEAGFTTCVLSPASPSIGDDAPRPGERAKEEAKAAEERMAARFLAYRRDEVARLFEAVRERKLDAGGPSPPLALLSDLAAGRKRHVACGAGRGVRAISASGDVYPCHRFVGRKEFGFGGIEDYRAGSMNDFHRTVVDAMPVCRSCWARYLCGGGCLYHNRAVSGDMRTPDPLRCREKTILCEDLVLGWCSLTAEDRDYLRGLSAAPPPDGERI